MKKSYLKILLISIVVSAISLNAREFITIGTGGLTGVYYPTGGYICGYLNRDKEAQKYIKKCNIESTGGSIFNLNAMNKKDFNFSIVQSDLAYKAYNGVGKYKGKKHPKLRAIVAIYPEIFTIVTKKSANIRKFTDLKGKSFNIGTPGSGDEATFLTLMNAYKKAGKMSLKDLKYVNHLRTSEAPNALKDGSIDGYVFVVGHPAANIKDVSTTTAIRIVPISGPIVAKFLKDHPYYTKSVIPGKIYKGVNKAVPSFGSKAVLVVNSSVPDQVVYEITKTIVKNLKEFKKLNSNYSSVTVKSLTEGLGAPMAKGSAKYFKEIGIIK